MMSDVNFLIKKIYKMYSYKICRLTFSKCNAKSVFIALSKVLLY